MSSPRSPSRGALRPAPPAPLLRTTLLLLLVAVVGAACNRVPGVVIEAPVEEAIVVTDPVPVVVTFGAGIDGSGFQATLDGSDVTAQFAVTPTGATATLPVGPGGAHTGRNRLVVTAGGGAGAKRDVVEFSVALGRAVAAEVGPGQEALLVAGPNARGRVGDYVLYNDLVQVVIEAPTALGPGGVSVRAPFGAHVYGGNLIDADLVRPLGEPERDNFEVVAPLLNVESTANYTSAAIVNDGADGQAAVVRMEGVDDVLDAQNLSSLIVFLGGGLLELPPEYDDRDLPVEVETTYALEPNANYVTITTTVRNTSAADLAMPVGDWVVGGGEGGLFFPGLGWGGTSGSGTMLRFEADYLAFVANGPAMAGVSYGYVPDTQGANDAVSDSGLNIVLHGESILSLLVGGAPSFVVPAGGSASYVRRFVVGNGDTTPVLAARDAVLGVAHEPLEGFVTSAGAPVVGARVSVLALASPPFQSGDVIASLDTDADGHFAGTVPAGYYRLFVNAEGHPALGPLPANVVAGIGTYLEVDVGATAQVSATVVDEGGAPIAAKLSVVGLDPSPNAFVELDVLGFLSSTGGVFRQDGDLPPPGVTTIRFAGADGAVPPFALEPGRYRIVASHGPEYDVAVAEVDVAAGAVEPLALTLRRVLDTPGFVSSDFHQHQQQSYDAATSDRTRVVTNLAEGLDFFVSTDHDVIADLAPALAATGAAGRIGYALGAEVTPSDYGHVNPWPLAQGAGRTFGALDWSRAAPPGADYPSLGAYGLTPGEIYAALRALPPADGPRVVQINHLNALQMGTFEALGVDTGLVPPASTYDPASFRLDPAAGNLFDAGFDAMELWIGASSDQVSELFDQNLGDWMNLLNQGIVRTATCNSDTHVAARVQSGAPRTFVASSTDSPAAIDVGELAQHVLAGRAFCSNGPFVRVTASAPSTGESAGLEAGQPRRLATADGSVAVTVEVAAAPWVAFDRIELYVNVVPQPVDADGDPATPPEYRVAPTHVFEAGADFTIDELPVNGSFRREATLTTTLAGLGTTDHWIVAVVRGTPGVSVPLFPVLPNDADPAQTLEQLFTLDPAEPGVRALAFTNPLFVDADQDEVYDPVVAAVR